MEASLIRPATEVVAQRLMERAKTVEGDARAVLETTAAMAGDPSSTSR
jgi:phosphotransferase system enzyme I (PtsI)